MSSNLTASASNMYNNLTIIKDVELPESMIKDILSSDSQVIEFLKKHRRDFNLWFSDILKREVDSKDSWVNYVSFTTGILNGYEWHNEKGTGGAALAKRGEYAGIIWIAGSEECGGSLSVLVNDTVEEIKFRPETAIVMPATMFHRVDHYYGSDTRISLNFTFDLVN